MSVKITNKLKLVNRLIKEDYKKLESLKLDDITNFMINYLKQKDNERIRYITKKKQFRYYQDGVWKVKEDFYIKREIKRMFSFLDQNCFSDQINKVFRNLTFITADTSTEEKFSDYNQSKNYINFKNGMLNLKTMELETHSPEHYSTFQLPNEYNSKAECPQWEEMLKEWLPDDTISFIQEYVGYLLMPENSKQIIPILYDNSTHNKRTVFIEIIQSLLGYDNVSNVELSTLTHHNRWTSRNLEGKLANICINIGKEPFEFKNLIKMMIAGDDVIAEVRFGPIYSYKPVTRFLFSTNKLPIVKKSASYSWYRRVKIVDFSNRLSSKKEYDQGIIDKLRKEMPGILNWAVEGLIRFRKNGKFTKSEQMIKDKKMYFQINDPISIFIDEYYELGNNIEEGIPTHLVYDNYKKWAEENGYSVEKKVVLNQHLGKKDVDAKNKFYNGKVSRHYLGIKEKMAVVEDE